MGRITMLVAALVTVTPLTVGQASAAADMPFADALFGATHNSYSGGAKGSIVRQLDGGIRNLEFDLHDNDFATTSDYSVGHESPGDDVDHTGGNPGSNSLRPWLTQVATWSAGHAGHAPIVVTLDVKDNLTDNTSFKAGNMAALNKELTDVFKSKLVWANDDEPASLPSVNTLRDRVIVVLSGDQLSRWLYRHDAGVDPAVDMNKHGQVVEVHKSQNNSSLWYWTGKYGSDGHITWLRHGQYDNGLSPAVALSDNGDIVEVHQASATNKLWYHVGKLGADGEIVWGPSYQYDTGMTPTVRFLSGTGAVTERHRNTPNTQTWSRTGSLNTSAKTVSWTASTRIANSPFVKYYSLGSPWVQVHGEPVITGGQSRLGYITSDINRSARIRFPQVAFVEFQTTDKDDKGDYLYELQNGALFYGSPASDITFIKDFRWRGKIVRGWDFDPPVRVTDPIASYLATNHPDADYWAAMRGHGVIEY